MNLTQAVWDTLSGVIDPELGIPVTDLGLVYRVQVADGAVTVEMTTTTPVCPLGEYLTGIVESRLLDLPGVERVDVRVVFDPPWTPERMSPAARTLLGWPG